MGSITLSFIEFFAFHGDPYLNYAPAKYDPDNPALGEFRDVSEKPDSYVTLKEDDPDEIKELYKNRKVMDEAPGQLQSVIPLPKPKKPYGQAPYHKDRQECLGNHLKF